MKIRFKNFISILIIVLFLLIELFYLNIIPNKTLNYIINNLKNIAISKLYNNIDNNSNSQSFVNIEYIASKSNLSTDNIINNKKNIRFATVSEAYFENSLFIGDSRMLGFSVYKHLPGATYFCYQSADVYTILSKEYEHDEYGMINLFNLLTLKRFDKIYIMLGINNVGAGIKSHQEHYKKFIAIVTTLQPDAIIYLLGNLHVCNNISLDNEYLNNERINSINQFISEFEDKKQIFYFDPNYLYDDEFGNMNKELSYDNAHIYLRHFDRLLNFLLTHAVVYDK